MIIKDKIVTVSYNFVIKAQFARKSKSPLLVFMNGSMRGVVGLAFVSWKASRAHFSVAVPSFFVYLEYTSLLGTFAFDAR